MLNVGNHRWIIQVILLYCEVWSESKQRRRRSIVGDSANVFYRWNVFSGDVFSSDIPRIGFSVVYSSIPNITEISFWYKMNIPIHILHYLPIFGPSHPLRS